MTRNLIKKVDDYVNSHMPWWDLCDSPKTCKGVAAKDVLEGLRDYFGDELDKALEDELRIEAYREALKANQTFFDDADTGYCPDSMVEGWGDVYLVKVEDGYILSDCTHVPAKSHRVSRAC